jgi:hypothetical protein
MKPARVGSASLCAHLRPRSPRPRIGEFRSDLVELVAGHQCADHPPALWSFYSWVLDEFWAADLPRTRSAFRDFYRPREALFAMACHVCDAPEHKTLVANMVGSRRVSPRAGDADFDPQFDYIKEALCGYGLYYRSAMELTGALIVAGPANGFPFDAPTPIGRALAAAFRDAVSGTHLAATFERGYLAARVAAGRARGVRESRLPLAGSGCVCLSLGSLCHLISHWLPDLTRTERAGHGNTIDGVVSLEIGGVALTA